MASVIEGDLSAQPHPGHAAFLAEGVWAPSAANSQPWRLIPQPDSASYELHYARRDATAGEGEALLAVGAFFETVRLAAERRGYRCRFDPALEPRQTSVRIGHMRVDAGDDVSEVDPLAMTAPARVTNRGRYRRGTLAPSVVATFEDEGAVLLAPSLVAAAVRSPWRLTRLLAASAAIAAVPLAGDDPLSLFAAGRQLLRVWVTATDAGLACHPVSADLTEPARRAVVGLAGRNLAAVMRVGRPLEPAVASSRRPLADVVVSAVV